MPAHERGPLGELVEELMRERNLTPHQIKENAGPGPGTLWLIRIGTTRHPRLLTLERLARALATHPYSKALDLSVMQRIYRALRVASGHGEIETLRAEGWLELVLADVVGDFALAQLWARFIHEHATTQLVALSAGITAFRAAVERERSIE